MKQAKPFGALMALLGLSGLIIILTADSHFPASQWPYESFQGLVFCFAWVLGFSECISYPASAIFVVAIFVACLFEYLI